MNNQIKQTKHVSLMHMQCVSGYFGKFKPSATGKDFVSTAAEQKVILVFLILLELLLQEVELLLCCSMELGENRIIVCRHFLNQVNDST